jgi:hypothetical protein
MIMGVAMTLLVEQWEDAVQTQIDLQSVKSITPKVEEQPTHYHPGFGRAEPWTITFHDGRVMDINGCPPALEQFRL